MIRRTIDSLGSVGLVLLIVGLVQYSVTNLLDWRVLALSGAGGAFLLIYLGGNFSRVTAALASRSARLGGMALASLLLVVGILILLNFINFRHHQRFDLSEGGLHSLSGQSLKVLEALKEPIQVIGFYQDPQESARFREQIEEYTFACPLITYEIVDPQREPARVQQYGVTRRGQIVVAAAARRETIESPTEEKLTNAILKVTRDSVKVVYFLTGHGERDLSGTDEKGYSMVRSEIEKQNYQVETLNLAQANAVPADAAVLISAGPQQRLFPNEEALLTHYLAQGGKLLLLVDPESGFAGDPLLAPYGLELADDRVVDATGLGQFYGLGAAAPLGTDYAEHPITRDLASAMSVYPNARSITLKESPLGYSTTALVRSSPQSWGESDLAATEVSFDEQHDQRGPLVLGALATHAAQAESAQTAEVSAEAKPETADDTAKTQPSPTSSGEGDTQPAPARESRIALFGDADFASNRFLGLSVNGDLFLNVVSWLAEDADLLSIRPRNPENRSVTMTASESRLIFLTTVILFPLATLLFGVAVWYRRR